MRSLPHRFENNRAWSERIRRSDPEFFSRLSLQHRPQYLWIGCPDSRIPVSVALQKQRAGLADKWLHHIHDVHARHGARVAACPDVAQRIDRLCEPNVIEQVANACRTTIVGDACYRGQAQAMHGWICGLDESMDLGRHRMRGTDATHMPHGWECGFLGETTTGTLLCCDLFTQGGAGEVPVTEGDIPGPNEAFRARMGYCAHTPGTDEILKRPAREQPKTLACMHGSAWRGDEAEPLRELSVSVCEKARLRYATRRRRLLRHTGSRISVEEVRHRLGRCQYRHALGTNAGAAFSGLARDRIGLGRISPHGIRRRGRSGHKPVNG